MFIGECDWKNMERKKGNKKEPDKKAVKTKKSGDAAVIQFSAPGGEAHKEALVTLSVLPSHQGRGAGRALLDAICSEAAQRGLARGLVATSAVAAGGTEGKCYGVNGCKGQSACKTAKNDCKGHNACKGKGFTVTSAEESKAAGGKFRG